MEGGSLDGKKDEVKKTGGISKMNRLAVIIGRFQVPKLHEGHLALFKEAGEDRTIVVVCMGQANMSQRYPLPYLYIAGMMNKDTYLLYNSHDDKAWSIKLDEIIEKAKHDDECPTLIVGRDSFKNSYSGKYKIIEIKEIPNISGTLIRDAIKIEPSVDFANGIIYAKKHRFPVAYHTVDIACMKRDLVLIGKKNGKWWFPGGFVDPSDNSAEEAAKRELTEEVDVEADDFKYICSTKIDDWRYRNEPDKIITSFFKCTYIYGSIKPVEEFSETAWVNTKIPVPIGLAKEHHILWDRLTEKELKNDK